MGKLLGIPYKENFILIDSYVDAPSWARYILRELGDGTARLELYEFGTQVVLSDFPYGALDEMAFDDTLKECRKLVGDSPIIFVETPIWMFLPEEFG